MSRSHWRLRATAAAAALLLAAPLHVRATPGQTATQGQTQGQTQTQGTRGAGAGAGQGQRGAGPAGGQRGQQRDPGSPQQQQRPTGTGILTGFVTLDGSNSPVRRARLNLSGAELRGSPASTQTDDKGFYTLQNLPAGRFTLNVSKPGYVTIAYGAKKPGRPGTAIQLADGQRLDRVNISLMKGAVITGMVIDESGEPSPQTQVRVMRYVMRTGEKTLESAGQDSTDDRGVYRIWGLLPGDYVVSAVPRNAGSLASDVIQSVLDSLTQQAQAGPGAGGRGFGGGALNALVGAGGRGGGRQQQLVQDANRLQAQADRSTPEQPVAYAPVYYPGTTTSNTASTLTLNAAEERSGVDFQLQLVPTATVTGSVTSPDGIVPQGIQISLVPQTSGPSVPGIGVGQARTNEGRGGQFSFSNVTPGLYTVMARAPIRGADPGNPGDPQAAGGGRGARGGGPGGFGPGGRGPTQVLWASADVTVSGQPVQDLTLHLQPGMTISGRVAFDGTTQVPPTDLTRVRVSLSARGQQNFDMGGNPPAQVDATGNFKITGVAPGRYVLSANVGPAADPNAPGGFGGGRGGGAAGGRGGGAAGAQGTGSWSLKSAIVNSRDSLDFPLEVRPNEDVSGALLTFGDQTQEVSGTLQDASGRPTSDFTIIVFADDKQFWLPQSRRIAQARPDTTGRFTVRGLPPGQYRVTAVTDVENGEWFDPTFLQQLITGSVLFTLQPGDKHTQDLRISGGGF